MSNFIKIWQFHEAPKDYQELSGHGGDEDWIAFMPSGFSYGWPMFLDERTSFGCCSVSEHKVDGGMIRIGAHA